MIECERVSRRFLRGKGASRRLLQLLSALMTSKRRNSGNTATYCQLFISRNEWVHLDSAAVGGHVPELGHGDAGEDSEIRPGPLIDISCLLSTFPHHCHCTAMPTQSKLLRALSPPSFRNIQPKWTENYLSIYLVPPKTRLCFT